METGHVQDDNEKLIKNQNLLKQSIIIANEITEFGGTLISSLVNQGKKLEVN